MADEPKVTRLRHSFVFQGGPGDDESSMILALAQRRRVLKLEAAEASSSISFSKWQALLLGVATMTTKAIPSHWPPDISYLLIPSYAPSMPSSLVAEIRGSRPSLPNPPCNRVSIRRITAKDHPAIGQYGLFATRNIAANSHICDYLGEVHCEDRNSDYDLSLLRSQGGINVGVDASRMGNEGRFINDYRGVKAKPNAIFKEGRTASGELRVNIWSASLKIHKGDEILVSYGKAWWRARTGSESGADHDSRTESVADEFSFFRWLGRETPPSYRCIYA